MKILEMVRNPSCCLGMCCFAFVTNAHISLAVTLCRNPLFAGYHNDHHYHYGYHVYVAAVVAKFDPERGMENFSKINLYIRDFANPSENDVHVTRTSFNR